MDRTLIMVEDTIQTETDDGVEIKGAKSLRDNVRQLAEIVRSLRQGINAKMPRGVLRDNLEALTIVQLVQIREACVARFNENHGCEVIPPLDEFVARTIIAGVVQEADELLGRVVETPNEDDDGESVPTEPEIPDDAALTLPEDFDPDEWDRHEFENPGAYVAWFTDPAGDGIVGFEHFDGYVYVWK